MIFPRTLSKLNYAGDFKMLEDFRLSFVGGTVALLTRAFFDLIYSTLQVWLTGFTTQDGFTFQSKAVWFALWHGHSGRRPFAIFQDAGIRSVGGITRRARPFFLLGAWTFLRRQPAGLADEQAAQRRRSLG